MLEETIAVRAKSNRPASDEPAPAPGIGVTDLDADVAQAIRAAVLRQASAPTVSVGEE